LAGRAYSPEPEPPRLPLLPKAVMVAFVCLAAFTIFVLLTSSKLCSGFVGQHLLFFLGWVVCGMSTAAWLMKAFQFQTLAEREKKDRLEDFAQMPALQFPNASRSRRCCPYGTIPISHCLAY
jgi:ribosome modulation factor